VCPYDSGNYVKREENNMFEHITNRKLKKSLLENTNRVFIQKITKDAFLEDYLLLDALMPKVNDAREACLITMQEAKTDAEFFYAARKFWTT
jgi:hypothetical protein